MSNKIVSRESQYQQYQNPLKEEETAPTEVVNDNLTSTIPVEENQEPPQQEAMLISESTRSQPSPLHSGKIIKRLKEHGVDYPLSKIMTDWQSQYSPDRRERTALNFSETATNPPVFVTPKHIYVKKKKVGGGAESDVFKVLQFPQDGSSPKKKVAKISRNSYEKQQASQLQVSPKGQKRINTFESVSRIQGQRVYIGVVPPAECDLENLSLDHESHPIFTIVKLSKDIAVGMAALHRTGQIHRDLKPANIVILNKGEEVEAQITDFGLVTREKKEEHLTALTPQYAPSFIWKNSVDQRNRRGVQTKEADVFSLGRTFLMGGVMKLLHHYEKTAGVSFNNSLADLDPTTLDIPSTDEELLDISRAAVGPVIIAFKGRVPSKVLLYPSQENIARILGQCLSQLNSHLKPSDLKMLHQYVDLVVSLQNNNPNSLPNMEEVEKSLQQILQVSRPPNLTFQLNKDEEGPSTSIEGGPEKKRSRSPEPKNKTFSLPVGNQHKKIKGKEGKGSRAYTIPRNKLS